MKPKIKKCPSIGGQTSSANVSDSEAARDSPVSGGVLVPAGASAGQTVPPLVGGDKEDVGEYALALAETIYLPSFDHDPESDGGPPTPAELLPQSEAGYDPGKTSRIGASVGSSTGSSVGSSATTVVAAFTPGRTLARSPPLSRVKATQVLTPAGTFKPRSSSTPDTYRDLNRDREVEVLDFEFEQPGISPQQILKRKREESRASRTVERSSPSTGANAAIKILAAAFKVLSGLVKGQAAVKPEIRTAVSNSVRAFNDLQREVKALAVRERSISREGPRAFATFTSASTSSVGCQTSGPDTVELSDLDLWHTGGETLESLRPLLDREWSDEALSGVTVVTGSALTCPSDAVACFAAASLEPGDSSSDDLISRLQARPDLLGQDPVPGSAVYVSHFIRAPRRKASITCEAHSKRRCRDPSCLVGASGFSQKEKFSFFLIDRPEVPDSPDETCIFESLIDLKSLLVENQLSRVAIMAHPSFRLSAWKKVIRAVFSDSSVEVTILRGAVGGVDRSPRDPTETVVVQGGKSFADTLKSMKNGLNPEGEGFRIAGIRSGRAGQVLVTLRGDAKRAATFTSLVNSKVDGVNAILGANPGRSKKLHLRQIEGDATAADIVAAVVAKYPGTLPEEVQVRSVRPSFSGRLNATVTATFDVATVLLRDKYLKIGWSTCSVVEREEALQCYRCRGYGHISNRCTGPDRSSLCRRCGLPGHTASNCTGEEKCVVCDVTGHRDGGLRCPAYRKALEAKRKNTRAGERVGEAGRS